MTELFHRPAVRIEIRAMATGELIEVIELPEVTFEPDPAWLAMQDHLGAERESEG